MESGIRNKLSFNTTHVNNFYFIVHTHIVIIGIFFFSFVTEAPGELGWFLTLVIVSLLSAGIGAVVMVTLIHCRRLKSANGRGEF